MKPILLWCASLVTLAATASPPTLLPPQAAIGRKIYFDTRLSNPPGVSCASCHDPDKGWAGNNGAAGGVAGRDGLRNTPTIGYVGYTPAFHVKDIRGETLAVGGLFWDGRADTLEAQARGPLFAKAEMNLAGDADFASRLKSAPYAADMRLAFGLAKDAGDDAWVRAGLAAMGAYQRSPELAPFSSKYDAWLRGEVELDDAEMRGYKLFINRRKGNCATCHAIDRASKDPSRHLFTNHTHVALGLPRNAAIAANADPKFHDLGLCGPSRPRPKGVPNACGAFKVPTLRNVAKRPFLFHNGGFTDLSAAVRFYVERDTHREKWYPRDAKGKVMSFDDLPRKYRDGIRRGEAPYDRDRGEAPRLNDAEIADVVAFLGTLDDGFAARVARGP